MTPATPALDPGIVSPVLVQTLAAALLAVVAVRLAAPPRARLPRVVGAPATQARPPVPVVAVLVAAAGAGGVLLEGPALVVVLLVAGAALGTWRAWLRHRASRLRERRRARVVEVGEALVGELRAGRPAQVALARATDLWDDLAPVAAAARLGADVPAALRDRSRLPGAEGLAELAAAWHVSQRSGAALAVSLGHVVATARSREQAAHLVRGELASARATARLVALLPVGTLAMAEGIGGDPWGFLLAHPVGWACLGAGTALVFAGLAWIDRMAAAVERP